MAKFIIMYNAGYGEEYEVVIAENADKAREAAYDAWREAAENNADYWAKPLTKETAERYDMEDELEDDESSETTA